MNPKAYIVVMTYFIVTIYYDLCKSPLIWSIMVINPQHFPPDDRQRRQAAGCAWHQRGAWRGSQQRDASPRCGQGGAPKIYRCVETLGI